LAGYDILNKWYENGSNYDEAKVKQFYYNIKPKNNGLKMGTINKIAKESNSELYKKLFLKYNTISDDAKEHEMENYNNIKSEF